MNPKRSVKSIAELAVHFPTLVKEDDFDVLQDQWQDLLSAKESLRGFDEKATVFWQEIRSVKDGNNHIKYDVLSKLMCGLLALPHSSACVERVFSQVNMIKTKHRLQADAIADRLLAKQAISRHVKKYPVTSGNHPHHLSVTSKLASVTNVTSRESTREKRQLYTAGSPMSPPVMQKSPQ